MICDRNVCGVIEQIENDIFEETFNTSDEFVTNLQHGKCRVIQLVRKQIQKFNDKKYELEYIKTDIFKPGGKRLENAPGENSVSKRSSMHFMHSTAQQAPTPEMRISNITDKVRHRMNLILAAIVIGILVWISLVYGALLGASLCSSSRSCFPFTPFKYSHAKHALF